MFLYTFCSSLLGRPWLTVFSVLIVFHIIRAVYRAFYHPLASFPGPKLAAISRWYEIYYEIFLGGRFAQHIDTLHQRYGPIVRVNPFEVHIDDPTYYDNLYNSDRHLEKRDYHISNVQHTGPYHKHSLRRRALAAFLTPGAIRRIEPLIKQNIDQLCRVLTRVESRQQQVTLSHLYRCMTADIITSYTLGGSYELLAKPNESKSFLNAFAVTTRLLWLLREIPYLSMVIRFIGKTMGKWMKGDWVIPTLLRWQWTIDRQLQGLCRDGVPAKSSSIASSYVRNSLPPEEKTAQHLHDTTVMLLAAGFETTGFTLTTATYHILCQPSILDRLQHELRTQYPSPSSTPSWQELTELPYLSAVIKESLRLSLGATARLPRINRKKDMVYGSWVIPKRTAVSMSHINLHHNEGVFQEPKAFKPERWLMGEESKLRERYLVPFSRGARKCMGIHLAHAELYLTLATIFRRFDLQLYHTTLRDVEPARDFFVPAPEPGGNGLRVLVNRRHEDNEKLI